MANLTAGGYITPVKPKTPPRSGLASVLGGQSYGTSDPFGLQSRNTSSGLDSLFPQQPAAYRPTAPQTQTQPRVASLAAPSTAPTANTTFQQPSAPGGGSIYSIDTDPGLQQVQAYAGRADAEAQAQALADKTRLVEQAGLPDLATALGLGGDVASVAAGNPFSQAANLKHSYELAASQLAKQNDVNRRDFTEQANQANLLYSGYKNRELAKLADAFATAQSENTRGYQGGLSGLAGSVQDRVAQIGSALAAALGASQQSRIAAEQAARDRAAAAGAAAGASSDGSGGNSDSLGGGASLDTYPGILGAILSAGANAARQRGQRGEYTSLFG